MEVSLHDILLLAFQSFPEALALFDAQGRVMAVNRAFEEITGYSSTSLSDFDIRNACANVGSDASSSRSLDYWKGPVCWPDPSGKKRLLYLTVIALRDAAGTLPSQSVSGHLVSVHSMPVQVEAQREVSSVSGEKLQALGILAGSIAHDLNNVLTGVLGHVSYLRLSCPEQVQPGDSLGAIEDGARRAASMTQQVLEYVKGEASKVSCVNLSAIIASAAHLFRPSLPPGINLELAGDEEDLFVAGDEGRLSQLVMNLQVNAREALPQGGEISVSFRRVHLGAGLSDESHALPSGDYVRLRITDNGSGIPAHIRPRIFDPFFTTKVERGTGLGLSTVLSIVEEHGGWISVESEEGKGTCFEVLFPLSSPAEERQSVTFEAEEEKVPTGSEKILVVDDEAAVRAIIQRSLEHLGYTVEVAKGGQEALERFQMSRDFRLVIVDMIMPHMAGDEVFFSLQQIDPNVPVLIASGYASDSRTRAVLDAGGLGFIQKPFSVEELAREVRRCLDTAPCMLKR